MNSNTLRRSRVSVAIRPLLGKPRRISFLSEDLFSTLPFTTVTGEAAEQQETVNLTETLRQVVTDGEEEKDETEP